MRQTVAAVIPTFNVAEMMEDCLRSVAWCDEIIVVDMFSTDRTEEVCRRFPNCRFFQRRGYIYDNFNFGMEQARSDWILRLDSDERVSPGLRDEILELLERPPEQTPHAAYVARMRSYVVGKRIDWSPGGAQPVRNTLVKRGRARYPARTEHDDFDIDGTVGRLEGAYDHYSTASIEQFIAKMNYYTERDIERMGKAQVRPPWKVLALAVRHFIFVYYQSRGYRDGYHGFLLSALRAIGLLVGDLKEWERAGDWRRKHRELVASHSADPERGGEKRPGSASRGGDEARGRAGL